MGGFSLMDYFKFIADSTFVSNVNKGITQTNDYFGTKTIQGMPFVLPILLGIA